MKPLVRVQLIVFTIVTLLSVGYGAVRFLDVGRLVDPPYLVEAEFATSGGIYPRADVELLGTRVGSVKEIEPGPDGRTVVIMAIDDDVEIPGDVRATIGLKSAIGEQYVELTPQGAGGPALVEGDRIPVDRTASPLPVEQLIGNLDALAGSVPTKELGIALEELSRVAEGLDAPLGRLIDSTDLVASEALASVDSLTALIRDARTVLDTQVELAPATTRALRTLAPLTGQLRKLDVDVLELFEDGVRAGTEVTDLLAANQQALPLLLNDLLDLTVVVQDRLPAVRKTLVVFPWVIELAATAIRHCEDLDADAGRPVAQSCEYDQNGDPIYKLWLAQQLDRLPPAAPYHPCSQGYEGTERYRPDGTPVDGTGGAQGPNSEPNLEAGCTASPQDPNSPNVRGAQNVPGYLFPGAGTAGRAGPGWAAYDGDTGLLATPDGTVQIVGDTGAAPPRGNAGLTWLLTQPLQGGNS